VVVSAVLSFVCYMLYYNLETMPGYIDGMIPLGLTAAVMLGLGISLVV
jgi:adenylate cyclase